MNQISLTVLYWLMNYHHITLKTYVEPLNNQVSYQFYISMIVCLPRIKYSNYGSIQKKSYIGDKKEEVKRKKMNQIAFKSVHCLVNYQHLSLCVAQ